MRRDDFRKLIEDVEDELTRGARSIGILGLTPIAFRLISEFVASGVAANIVGIYNNSARITQRPFSTIPLLPLLELRQTQLDVVIVAADACKEDLLRAALPYLSGIPKIIIAGYRHLRF